jgi:hypothetical protein
MIGANTDHWSLADTNHKLMTSSKTPQKQNAQAVDSEGDVVAETVFDTRYTYEAQYRHVGTAAWALDSVVNPAKLGQIVASNKIITGITIATTNTERPTVTVTGEDYAGDTATQQVYATGLSVPTGKIASGLGAITPDANSRIVSSTANCTAQVASAQDSEGTTVTVDVYAGRVEVSAELQSATAVAGATADTGYTADGGTGSNEENTGYGGSTFAVFKNIAGA